MNLFRYACSGKTVNGWGSLQFMIWIFRRGNVKNEPRRRWNNLIIEIVT